MPHASPLCCPSLSPLQWDNKTSGSLLVPNNLAFVQFLSLPAPFVNLNLTKLYVPGGSYRYLNASAIQVTPPGWHNKTTLDELFPPPLRPQLASVLLYHWLPSYPVRPGGFPAPFLLAQRDDLPVSFADPYPDPCHGHAALPTASLSCPRALPTNVTEELFTALQHTASDSAVMYPTPRFCPPT